MPLVRPLTIPLDRCLRHRRRRGRNRIARTAWQSNKFLDPITDGAVLPILHFNGYKISNPTVLSRIEHEELDQFLRGCGWTPYFVEGDEPEKMHHLMAATIDKAVEDIQRFQKNARSNNNAARPRWPMIVLSRPKDGLAQRSSTDCKSREPFAPTRCRFWSIPTIPITSSCSRTG